MERKMIDYEAMKAHIEERIAYYVMQADSLLDNEDYNCCDFAMCIGASSAYTDMLHNLDEVPF